MTDASRTLRSRCARFLRHPASVLVWVVVFSLIVKENYPFSHYPMYSGFEDKTYYFYLTSEGEPVPAKPVFRVSVPRIKKIHGNFMKEIAEGRDDGTRPSQLDAEAQAEAGRQLLDQLRAQMPEGRRERYAGILAKPLTLVRVDIRYEDGTFSKTRREIVTH